MLSNAIEGVTNQRNGSGWTVDDGDSCQLKVTVTVLRGVEIWQAAASPWYLVRGLILIVEPNEAKLPSETSHGLAVAS